MTDTSSPAASTAPEPMGRFGHQPDPAGDFCIEVEVIEGMAYDVGVGAVGSDPHELDRRIASAMEFRVGGDEIAVRAKRRLRGIEGARLAGRTRSAPLAGVPAASTAPQTLPTLEGMASCEPHRHDWYGVASTNGPSDLMCRRCGARSTEPPHILRARADAALSRSAAVAHGVPSGVVRAAQDLIAKLRDAPTTQHGNSVSRVVGCFTWLELMEAADALDAALAAATNGGGATDFVPLTLADFADRIDNAIEGECDGLSLDEGEVRRIAAFALSGVEEGPEQHALVDRALDALSRIAPPTSATEA